jgi:hypothetical protein
MIFALLFCIAQGTERIKDMPDCVLCKQPVDSENNYLCEECFIELAIAPLFEREEC